MERIVFLISLAFVFSGASAAENLLQDPGFADGLDPPWTVLNNPGAVSWEVVDENGSADSGSLLFVDGGEFGGWVAQCVNISAEPISGMGYSYLIPNAVVDPVFVAEIFVSYYTTVDCTGTAAGSDSVAPESPLIQGAWTRVSGPADPPPGAVTARFSISMSASGSSDNQSFVDNVLFGDPPLFRDRFEAP